MAVSKQRNSIEHKNDKAQNVIAPVASHMEEDLKYDNTQVLKSSMDSLGLLTTARRFWKASIVPECSFLKESTM